MKFRIPSFSYLLQIKS